MYLSNVMTNFERLWLEPNYTHMNQQSDIRSINIGPHFIWLEEEIAKVKHRWKVDVFQKFVLI